MTRKHYLLFIVTLQNENISRASKGWSQNETPHLPDILELEVRRLGFLVFGIFKIRITEVTEKKATDHIKLKRLPSENVRSPAKTKF